MFSARHSFVTEGRRSSRRLSGTSSAAVLQAEAAFVAFLGRNSRRTAICVRILLLAAWGVRLATWAMSPHDTPNVGGSIIIVAAIVTCLALSESQFPKGVA